MAVGADSGVVTVVVAAVDDLGEALDPAGSLPGLADRKYQTTNPSKRTETDTRTVRRARMRNHSMGMAGSAEIAKATCLLIGTS